MNNSLISVIIPVYNVRDYLCECLNSVTAQSWQNLEILAVDDGSDDGSAQLLAQMAEADHRIQVLHKPNGGLSDARNYGLERAQGEMIAFVDGDDRIAPDMIESLQQGLIKTGSDIAVCDMEYFYPDAPAKSSSGGDFSCTSTAVYPPLIRINNSACNKLYRRSVIGDLRFPVGRYYEDLALIPILLYRAKEVRKISRPLYFYRQRTGSIAHTASPQIFDIYSAIDGVIDYVKQHGSEPQIISELMHLYIVHGLDLTTLRIRDFDDKTIRADYLKQNMERLQKSYPDYQKDSFYRTAGWRKKMIYRLLAKQNYTAVLKIYDRK